MNKLKIETLIVGQLRSNCYLVYESDTNKGLIIDPADDAEYITNTIRDMEMIPEKIIATHGHFDHFLAVNELKMAYKIPFLLSKADERMLKWARKSSIYFTRTDCGPPPTVDKYLKGDQKINVGKSKLLVIETPGHSPGGISLYCLGAAVLFSGDTIFAHGSFGRVDLPYSSWPDMQNSIKKLMELPGDTRVLSGHGEETTIADYAANYSYFNTNGDQN